MKEFISKNNRKNSGGYILLITVILVSAVSAAAMLFMLASGVSSTETALANVQSKQAFAAANACAEEGLEQFREGVASGTGNLSLANATCSYTISGSTAVFATGTTGTIVRKIKVSV